MVNLTAGFDQEIRRVESEARRLQKARDAELARLQRERDKELGQLEKRRLALVELREKMMELAPPPPKRKYTKRSAHWNKKATKTKPKTTTKRTTKKTAAKSTTKRT